MIATASTPSRSHARIVQDGKDLLRTHPALYINLLASNLARRLQNFLMLSAASTELTLPMRRNINSDRRRPQMCHMAKKLHRTFSVAILHFAIGRTHPAERLNPALNTLRYSRAFTHAQFAKRVLPCRFETRLSDVKCLLLRNHTYSHLPVSVNRESVHSAAAEIHAVVLCKIRRILQVVLRQPAILAHTLGRVHIQRYHFLRRQPNCQWTL